MGRLNICEFSSLSLGGASDFVNGLRLSEREHEIARRVLKGVGSRLGFLIKVGLGYLTLDRPASTLSGGEAQRVRLATQLGASLTGVLYVLDEPSIGLHPRDCRRLLDTLTAIKDAENTVIIVEHDEETIRWADHVVDLGPGGGRAGGWVVAEGTPGEIQHNRRSLTGEYLSKRRSIPVPASRRKAGTFLRVSGISEHNLKNITVDIPLGIFTCVTGVSGSGKSSLVMDVLYRALLGAVHGLDVSPGRYRQLSGVEKVTRVISVEQKPLGKTPRSNPATYTGVFNHIRDLFSRVREARIRGYTPGRFSFNLRGGRCETCRGEGCRKVEMHFLPDVYVPCDDCGGKRYNRETLQVRYRDRSIADVLEMTLSEAYDFFSGIPAIRGRLQILMDVGLGYVRLGQSATTLSGGEAQRVRLAKELGRQSGGNTLYILDEPTTGLHFVDIERLLHVIYELVKRDNTVVVIEHNLDVIKSADYIIDLGPEGGDEGGYVVAAGTPEEVAAEDGSYTGSFLRERLNGSAAGIEPGQGEQV